MISKDKMKTLLYKAVPFLSALAIVVACCHLGFITASASVYNYEDYILRVSVDGENDLCVVQFPVEFWRLTTTVYGDMKDGDGNPIDHVTWVNNGGDKDAIVFRYDWDYLDFTLDMGANSNYLNVTNIPSGSIMEFRIRLDVESTGFDGVNYTSVSANVIETMRYFDSGYNELAPNTKTFNSLVNFNGVTNCRLPIDKPNNAYCAIPSVTWNRVTFDLPEGEAILGDWTVESCNLVFTISSAFREAGVTGEYGELIYAITKELAKNQESAESFYDYMETEMGVTKDQLDDIMAETAENSESLEHIKTQQATIIAGQDVIVDQQDQMIGQNQTQIDQNQQMIEQNNTIITGSEEAEEQLWFMEAVENAMKDAADKFLNDIEVERPELDYDDFTPDKWMDGDVLNSYIQIISIPWESNTFEVMCIVCVSLVLVSFIFFGKK